MRIRELSGKLKWGISYLFTVIFFTFIYTFAHDINPDSFLINPELNKEPISDVRSYLYGNKDSVAIINPAESLSEYQKSLNIVFLSIGQLEQRMKKNTDDIEAVEGKRKKLWEDISKYRSVEIEKYKREGIHDIAQEENLMLSKIKELEIQSEYLWDQSSIAGYPLKIAHLKVDLAEIRVRKAKKEHELSSYVLNKYGTFITDEYISKVDDIENELDRLLEIQISIKDQSVEQRSKLHEYLETWSKERSSLLTWQDFVFYSLGISTTTTFGDITANNRTMRWLVSIQLLLSVVIVAGFINAVFENNANK